MLNKDTKVVDVIDDPLFKGYGRLIFPTAFGRPSSSMPLSQVGSMLIYHNYVNTETTLDVIGYMMKEVKAGRKIFYDIYTEAEKRRDPDKRDTGLFFFRGKPGAPFGLISAGDITDLPWSTGPERQILPVRTWPEPSALFFRIKRNWV